MKQTLEEAAIKHQNGFSTCEDESVLGAFSNGMHHQSYKSFIAGAEWQAKQSPWISIKDKLPEPGQEVFLYDKDSVTHYAVGWLRKKKGYCESGWFVTDGYVTDESITHWMPIPKFN